MSNTVEKQESRLALGGKGGKTLDVDALDRQNAGPTKHEPFDLIEFFYQLNHFQLQQRRETLLEPTCLPVAACTCDYRYEGKHQ